MVGELATRTLRAGAPAPSVETLLHAILPQNYVDHTHADAVLSISNAPDGESRIREIYGDQVVVIPYIMPGFDLAAYCAREFSRQSGAHTIGMVLLSHGVFSFGADAKESYERMIQLVAMAEAYLASRNAWVVGAPAAKPANAGAKRSRSCVARFRRPPDFRSSCGSAMSPKLADFRSRPGVVAVLRKEARRRPTT
jgi:rhamnose utilization protein RhaD (predicted bifunctional aldolase and dehydrogenase)